MLRYEKANLVRDITGLFEFVASLIASESRSPTQCLIDVSLCLFAAVTSACIVQTDYEEGLPWYSDGFRRGAVRTSASGGRTGVFCHVKVQATGKWREIGATRGFLYGMITNLPNFIQVHRTNL